MTEPNRIIVDFFEVSENAEFQKHPINDLGIESIRIAMFEETTARVVFDFLEEIPAYQIRKSEEGIKLLFWSEASESQQPIVAQPAEKPPPPPEPELRIEEMEAETDLPSQRTWILPLEQAPLNEPVWTAREVTRILTTPPLNLVLTIPAAPLQLSPNYWPGPPPPPPVKPKEKIPAQPEIVTPAKTPVKETSKPEKKEVVEKKEEKESPTQVIPKPQISTPTAPPPNIGPVTLGLGVGTSMGGAGGFVQYNATSSLAVHAGLGMYPTSFVYSDTDWVKNEMLYSVGLKYYLPFKSQYLRPYLDVQYGGFAIEAVQVIVGIYEYQYIYQNEQKALYGPSALLGGEVKLGALGLNLAGGISYATTPWEWQSQEFYFSFDIGLIYNFR
jgi:hypothetical protein